jgi:hypothetical protein
VADPSRHRFRLILARERGRASAIARAVFETKPFSVWEVLVPFVLIYNLTQRSRLREHFAANWLFTKKLALEGALDVARGSRSLEEVRARIDAETARVLASTPPDLYSEEIRERQREEIDMLIDHYVRLLGAEGEDHAALVRAAYGSRVEYESLLDRIAAAEREVSAASVRTLRAKGDPDVARRMEAAAARLRAAEAAEIFGGGA